MKLFKQYLYKCMYMHQHIEDMAAAGYISKENSEIDAQDDDELIITITSEDVNNETVFIAIARKSDNETILGYQDKGETMRFLKGLGRFNTAAFIASCIQDGQEFCIMDKDDKKYSIARISVMGNKYLVFGGYENPTGFININGLHPKQVTYLAMRKIISDNYEFCMFDYKSLHIKITQDIASLLKDYIFTKPYVNCEDFE